MARKKMTVPKDIRNLYDLLKERSEFYIVLAGFYNKPLTQEQIDHMGDTDFSKFHVDDGLIDDGFNDIYRALRKRHTGTRSQLATEWTSTFGGAESYEGHYCVPDASVFLDESETMYGWPRDEAYDYYIKQGLHLENKAGLPESHISFELEFLSIVSTQIIECLKASNFDEAVEKINVSQEFIEKHILTWVPKLYELASKMFKTRFYRGVLKLTIGYLELDKEVLADMEKIINTYRK